MQEAKKINYHPDQRLNQRVVFTRTVNLSADGKKIGKYPARDLSMGGLFILGEGFPLNVSADCELELHETGKHSSLILKFLGKVVRVEHNGIAVEFKEMEDDSFMFLQTMVLYASDDPIGIAQDFLEDFSEFPHKE